MSIKSVMPSNLLMFCCPLLLLPSVCPSIDSMDYSTSGFPVHQLPELAQSQTHVHLVSDAIQQSHPLLSSLLAFNLSSTKVFSSESVLHIRWSKDWSFSFNISPSNEHTGLISFRMDRLDLLAVQGLSRVFSNTTVQKNQFLGAQLSL